MRERERERESTHVGGEGQREEEKIPSRLHAVSAKPDRGLDSRKNHVIPEGHVRS